MREYEALASSFELSHRCHSHSSGVAFPRNFRIYVEERANEYCPRACCLPWLLVTSRIGHCKVGWRKSVCVLDWERTRVAATADELFAAEDVTKGGRWIHCHGYEALERYLAVLAAWPG